MPRPALNLVRAAAFLCLGAACILSAPASAHIGSISGPTTGIPVHALTHGQMAVIADYRGEILALAGRQVKTDPTFRRLLDFSNIQYTYCLWGLVPGSLRDENSPFNECSHAYLSAVQALLVHMRDMPGDRQPVEDLISRIDADMVRNQASFVQCQFSAETFNTAGVIRPSWGAVPYHAASLVSFATLALGLTAGGTMLFGSRRKDSRA